VSRYDNHELMAAVELASQHYGNEMMQGIGVDRDAARTYVGQRRLFSPMIEKFRVGYAPTSAGWLLGKNIAHPDLLVAAGLLNRLGFVGRSIKISRDKYLSTGSTPIFRRAEVLYRIDRARRSIESTRTVIVVEGLLDAALMFQVGIRNVVATGTKAMTDSQAQILARYALKVEVMFDNEPEARKAFDLIRRRRGTMFQEMSWREYPAKFNDPADWVAARIDRLVTDQQAAV